jgi:hypothetical protein
MLPFSMKYPSLLLIGVAASALADSTGTYSVGHTIPWSPKTPSSVDQGTIYNGTYYLSDRTNAAVHVVDLSTNTQTALVTGFVTGLVNGSISSAISGPNGLVVLPDRNEIYAGDGDGTIKVINLLTNAIIATISTGSKKRADEFAYDSATGTIVATHPNDATPYVSIINAATRAVTGKVLFPNATELEQPVYNSASKQFYVSVPSNPTNPGGEIAVLDLSNSTIAKTYPIPQCIPAGIVLGAANRLFIGCSESQITDSGYAASYIMDMSTGNLVSNISGLAGVDQVAHSASTGYFYAAAYQDSPEPLLAVISSNGTLVQKITTDNVTAHSVAVDQKSGVMVVPIKSKGIVIYDLGNGGSATNSSSGNATATGSVHGSAGRREVASGLVLFAVGVVAALNLL